MGASTPSGGNAPLRWPPIPAPTRDTSTALPPNGIYNERHLVTKVSTAGVDGTRNLRLDLAPPLGVAGSFSSPKILESVWRQLGIANRVLDILVAEPSL